MFEVLEKKTLASNIKLMTLCAPTIAGKAKAGQFIILRVDETGERFPLTLVTWNPGKGTISIVFQEVGTSTRKLGTIDVGNRVQDIAGPLGNASEVKAYGNVVVIGGGVGIAPALPIATVLKAAGNKVTSIIGARTADLLILQKEMRATSNELLVVTDDGSKGRKGFTSDALEALLTKNRRVDYVFAVGPVPMMKAIAEVTRPLRIRTMVSLNPIMIDGTGMCGGCRVSVGGKTRFACVDGPEFDAHQVNFVELSARLQTYTREERRALKHFESQKEVQT